MSAWRLSSVVMIGSACTSARQELGVPDSLVAEVNGERFGAPEAGVDMTFDFPRLIAHAAKTRRLAAGTIVGSGTVSNRDRSRGSCCIAERRMLEKIEAGAAQTPFLKAGDQVRIEMLDRDGLSLFGAIEQVVEAV